MTFIYEKLDGRAIFPLLNTRHSALLLVLQMKRLRTNIAQALKKHNNSVEFKDAGLNAKPNAHHLLLGLNGIVVPK